MFWKKNHLHGESEIVIVYDIGSTSVGGAFVMLSADKPHMLYSFRKDNSTIQAKSPKEILTQLKTSLSEVSNNLLTKGIEFISEDSSRKHILKSVHTAYCVYASQWYISQATKIDYTNKESIPVTKQVIDALIEDNRNDFENSNLGKEAKNFDESLIILEEKITQVLLNGYEVIDPIGKSAKDISVSFFMSLMPEKVQTIVEDTIHKSFHITDFHHSSFALTSYSVMSFLAEKTHDFLFIDVGGLVTDVLLVNEKRIKENVSFPFGKKKLLEAFCEKLKISPEEALSRLVLFAQKMLDESSFKNAEEVISVLKQDWNSEFCLIVDDFSKTSVIPHNIYLIGDNDVHKLFSEFIQTGNYKKYIACDDEFDITFVDSTLLKDMYVPARVTKDDIFLIFEALYAHAHFTMLQR